MPKLIIDTCAFSKHTEEITNNIIKACHTLAIPSSSPNPFKSQRNQKKNNYPLLIMDEYIKWSRFSLVMLPRINKLKSKKKISTSLVKKITALPRDFKKAFKNKKDEHLIISAIATESAYVVTKDKKVFASMGNNTCRGFYNNWGITIIKHCKDEYHKRLMKPASRKCS